MLVRIAELDIEPAHLEVFKSLLAAEIRASVGVEPGVLALQAVALKDMPTQIRLLEVYADQKAYEGHLRSPHFLHYKHASVDMVRSLRLLEVEPVELCAKPGFAKL